LEKVFKVGGASAIGAMAYGTETIPKVDVITGPGNIFVATAKKLVYGEVNIDMIAGPSEIGIIADVSARVDYLAMDLLSQAEHDEMASSILITDNESLAIRVSDKVAEYLSSLSREPIARKSIEERGAIIVAKDMEEAVSLMNRIAPEHLEVVTANYMDMLPSIKHAGAIFLGPNTPEPIGDYIAGPNHTLPTGGTARFYSPLSVENFLKKSSIISMSQEGINAIGHECAMIANVEGLTAHESSVRMRLDADVSNSHTRYKRFQDNSGDTDMLGKLGIDINGDQIQIDLDTTRRFFDNLQESISAQVGQIDANMQQNSQNIGENIGIQIDNDQINIDLEQTKNFIGSIGAQIEKFVSSLSESQTR